MSTKVSVNEGGFSLVDYSIDPHVLLESLKFAKNWLGWYTFFLTCLEFLGRFPSVEYAIGFDGVDDYVSIPKLDIDAKGLEFETSIWISRENQGSHILSISDRNDDRILTLAATNEENFQIKAFYKEENKVKNQTVKSIELEKWQKIRIDSDGEILSISVDGNQVIFLNEINLENAPFNLEFGRGSLNYFDGMIRNLKVNSGKNEVFRLQSGNELDIKDETNSAVIAGIHNIRKGRLENEFK